MRKKKRIISFAMATMLALTNLGSSAAYAMEEGITEDNPPAYEQTEAVEAEPEPAPEPEPAEEAPAPEAPAEEAPAPEAEAPQEAAQPEEQYAPEPEAVPEATPETQEESVPESTEQQEDPEYTEATSETELETEAEKYSLFLPRFDEIEYKFDDEAKEHIETAVSNDDWWLLLYEEDEIVEIGFDFEGEYSYVFNDEKEHAVFDPEDKDLKEEDFKTEIKTDENNEEYISVKFPMPDQNLVAKFEEKKAEELPSEEATQEAETSQEVSSEPATEEPAQETEAVTEGEQEPESAEAGTELATEAVTEEATEAVPEGPAKYIERLFASASGINAMSVSLSENGYGENDILVAERTVKEASESDEKPTIYASAYVKNEQTDERVFENRYTIIVGVPEDAADIAVTTVMDDGTEQPLNEEISDFEVQNTSVVITTTEEDTVFAVSYNKKSEEQAETESSYEKDGAYYFTEEGMKAAENADLSSGRILVCIDSNDIVDPENLIGILGNVCLMQYEDLETARKAYAHYYTSASFISADMELWAADEEAAQEDEDDEQKTPISVPAYTSENNPFVCVQKALGNNAYENSVFVIDTGMPGADRVVSHVSVIGEDANDDNGHGTRTLEGIVSQDENANIVSVKALDGSGKATAASVFAALYYADCMQASIIVLPFVGRAAAGNEAIEQAVLLAQKDGSIIIAAAGNEGESANDYIPAGLNGVYAIGACDESGVPLASSNFDADYYVVAGSTSEAAAKFAGYVSKNGIDNVANTVNYNGLIFAPGYIPASDESAAEETPVFAETVPEDEGIIDPAIEQYIKDHAEGLNLDDFALVDVMKVQQVLFSSDVCGPGSTVDGILGNDANLEYWMGSFFTILPVFNISDESEYYAAFVNTLQDDPLTTAVDCVFAVDNTKGEVIDGKWDADTGIAYIPKSAYDEATAPGYVQAEVLHSVRGQANMLDVSSDTTVYVDDLIEGVVQSDIENIYSMETTVLAEPGMDEDKVNVEVNGFPVNEDGYSYDPESGEVTINASSASVLTVNVTEEETTFAEQVADTASELADVVFNTVEANAALPPVSNTLGFEIPASAKVGCYAYGNVLVAMCSGEGTNFRDEPTVKDTYAYIYDAGWDQPYEIGVKNNALADLIANWTKNKNLEEGRLGNKANNGIVGWYYNQVAIFGHQKANGEFEDIKDTSDFVWKNAKGNNLKDADKINVSTLGTLALNCTHITQELGLSYTKNTVATLDQVNGWFKKTHVASIRKSKCIIRLLKRMKNGDMIVGIIVGGPQNGGEDQTGMGVFRLPPPVEPEYGQLKIVKIVPPEWETFVANNTNYSFKGAEFNVHNKADKDDDDDYTLVTGSEGAKDNETPVIDDLEYGTYVITETKAPAGYIRDATPHEVTLTENNSKDPLVYAYSFPNTPKTASGTAISLLKSVGEGEQARVLSGAEFTITFSAPGGATATWTIRTDPDGVAKLAPGWLTGDSGRSFIVGSEIRLPLGNIKLEETKAPNGFIRDTTPHYGTVTASGDTAVFNWTDDFTGCLTNTKVQDSNVYKNVPIFAGVSIRKVDKDLSEFGVEGDADFEGVTFEIKRAMDSDAPSYDKWPNYTTTYYAGDTVATITVSAEHKKDGYTETLNNALQAGFNYTIQEVATDGKDSYALTDGQPRTITLLSNLAEEGKDTIYPAFGEDTYENGQANEIRRGGVHIYKADYDTNKYTAQGDAVLSGIRFAVVNSSADKVRVDSNQDGVIDKDDSVDAVYQPGQVVLVLTTNDSGEAVSTNVSLPYGTYDVYELRADSTIEVGDIYASSTDKYGSSKYANNDGNADAMDTTGRGSMLFAEHHEQITIKKDGEMAGEEESDNNYNNNTRRLQFQNKVVRGGFEAYKLDKETLISYALDGASLEGIKFKLYNRSEHNVFVINAKYPEGHEYAPGDAIDTVDGAEAFVTDRYGMVCSGHKVAGSEDWGETLNDYLPYGTYELVEEETNKSYMHSDKSAHKFIIREDGEVIAKDEDRKVTEASEYQAYITSYPDARGKQMFVLDQVLRGDIYFDKVDENYEALPHVAFMLRNKKTGETHFIVTDENGYYNSSSFQHGQDTESNEWSPHTLNTNAYDEELSKYAPGGELQGTVIPQSVLDDLWEKNDGGRVGTWFGMSQNVLEEGNEGAGTVAEPDDTLCAFPFGEYDIIELKSEANADKTMFKGTFTINKNELLLDLGTKINRPVTIETVAKDVTDGNSNVKTITIVEHTDNEDLKAIVEDETRISGLRSGEKYRLRTEMHLIKKLENGTKVDGGLVYDADKNPVVTRTTFTAKNTYMVTQWPAVNFNSCTLYDEGGEKITGGTVVMYAYLYFYDAEAENNEGEEVASHADIEDKQEQLVYPYIGTKAVDSQTNLNIGLAREEMVIHDYIEFHNLPKHKQWTFKGTIIDKDTNEVLQKSQTTEPKNAPAGDSDSDGEAVVTFTIDTTGREGHTLVVFEECWLGNTQIYATHADMNDDKQSIHIPKIATQAKDKETGDEVGKVVGTFVDTVAYENLLPGLTYRMNCVLYDKDSKAVIEPKNAKKTITDSKGNVLPVVGTAEFTAKAGSDPYRADGTVTLEYDLSGVLSKEELEGKTVVAFEYLEVIANQVEGNPPADVIVAEHNDPADTAQTVYYPKIRTTGADGKTLDHVGTVEKAATITDEIQYWNLVPGKEYAMQGSVYVKETYSASASPVATLKETFTPDSANGTYKMTFNIDSTKYEGKTLVVHEKLFHNNVEVTQHEVLNEDMPENKREEEVEAQSIHYPIVKTTAHDEHTNGHVGTVADKVDIVDKVEVSNLIPGMTYMLSGTLHYRTEGTDPAAAKEVESYTTAPVKFTAKAETEVHDMVFTVDSWALEGKTVVVFEKLYHPQLNADVEFTPDNDKIIEVAKHEVPNDHAQSIYYPKVRTIAADSETKDHVGTVTEDGKIVDTIEFENLIVGETYTFKGILYDKATKKELAQSKAAWSYSDDADTKKYTARFAAEKANGTVDITFDIDASKLEGETIVVVEQLLSPIKDNDGNDTDKDYVVNEHNVLDERWSSEDLEKQSIHYPKIRTEAKDADTGDHVGKVPDGATIIDTVTYENLIPGMTYFFDGYPVVKEDTTDAKNPVKMEVKSTDPQLRYKLALEDSASPNGSVTISFKVDAEKYENKTAVVFEQLYHPVKNEEGGKQIKVTVHEDINDEAQSVHYPQIDTTAHDQYTNSHVGTVSEVVEVKDKVTMNNLVPGNKYTVYGALHYQGEYTDGLGKSHHAGELIPLIDPDSKHPATDDYPEGYDAMSKTFVATKRNEEIILTFKVNSLLLEGTSAVAFEDLEHVVIVASHHDIDDDDQIVHYPKIRTMAKDLFSGDHVGTTAHTDPSSKNNQIVDTIMYENFVIGETYRIKGTLIDKATGKVLAQADAAWKVADDEETQKYTNRFQAEAKSGTVDIRFDIDTSALDGKTVVVYEQLYSAVKDDDGNITDEDALVDEHERREDGKGFTNEDQMIHYPKVATKARDINTDDHVGRVGNPASVIDTVTMTNLIPGMTYTVSGKLMSKQTKQEVALLEESTTTLTFTADATSRTEEFTFVVDSSVLRGDTVVAFEYLSHPYENAEEGEEVEWVATHEDLGDEGQSVHYPWIRTIAVDSKTGDHVGTIYGDEINGFRIDTGEDIEMDEKSTIIDTVLYKNLVPGAEYSIVGTLMNKETQEPIKDKDGKVITSVAKLRANRHDANGEAQVVFTVDTSYLKDVTIVCFEKLYHKNTVDETKNENEHGVEVDRHEDFDDEDQSIHELDMWTKAADEHTGNHTGDATGMTKIVDLVTVRNLVKGAEYTVTGTLYDKDTEDKLLDEDGNPYVQTVTFTASEDDEHFIISSEGIDPADGSARINGSVRVEFEVNGKYLEGKKVVTFEDLFHNKKRIYTHSDINDFEQSVWYPWIRTHASDEKNDAKETQISQDTKIKDIVEYKNLIPGTVYRLDGTLMDRVVEGDEATAVEMKDKDGNVITATATFTAEEEEGTQEIVFGLDTMELVDHIVVAFEKLTLLDEEDEDYEVPVAIHEDITDDEQAEWIIDIQTHASDSVTGVHESEARPDGSITDHVTYQGLIPGAEYVMTGILIDKETEKAVMRNDAPVIVSQNFTPEAPDGAVDVVFTLDTSDMAGKHLVVFEFLSRKERPDVPIAKHEDPKDPDQSIEIIKIYTTALDSATLQHEGQARTEATIEDEVFYENLTPGKKYVMKGHLVDKETGKAISEEVAKEFVPEERNGSVILTFVVDTSEMGGRRIVAFEKLYTTEKEFTVIAHHEDLDDEDQTVNVIEIATILTDSSTKLHESEARTDTKLTDTVYYKGLTPGKEYIVHGVLMDKATGKEVIVGKKTIEGFAKFVPKKSEGTVEIAFEADMAALAGKIVVAFETLYTSEKPDIPVATHEDLNDKDQSVWLVKILTNLTAIKTGKHTADAIKDLVLVDRVSYEGLIPGTKYTVRGELMDKETGKGTGIKASTTFTAKTTNGYVDLSFKLDGTKYAGKKLVAFETLYDKDVKHEIATHKDIKDKDQTVDINKTTPPKDVPKGTPEVNSPKTGDDLNVRLIAIIIGVIALMGGAGAFLVFRGRKKKGI